MSRSTVNRILAVYFIVVWGAVIVRSDRFPLTWAPMYSTYSPNTKISVRITDKERMARGILVTHSNGSTSYIAKEDLNIPKWNFWRLYYQRLFRKGPPKHRQGNRSLGSFNRWIRGLEDGEANFSANWDWRVLWGLNKTLGFEPADPRFIVRAQAEFTRRHYEKADLSNVWQTQEQASLEWQTTWESAARWNGSIFEPSLE